MSAAPTVLLTVFFKSKYSYQQSLEWSHKHVTCHCALFHFFPCCVKNWSQIYLRFWSIP